MNVISELESMIKDEESKREPQEEKDPHFEHFLREFETQKGLEDRLQFALHFMEQALSQGAVPQFRHFWEVRRICLALFKENISPNLRSQFWSRYSELSQEARRIKELLDEQSAFAVEQIEIAISALEKEIENREQIVIAKVFPEEFVYPQSLKEKKEFYSSLQKQLNLLNTEAARINALRKELLKTDMRIRQKNKFFQRLSHAGDKVFPQRKELIKEVSQQFTEDVEYFIREHFEKTHHESLYTLREEIKSLQGLAKILTLNTHSFTQTRMHLSECWDKLKVEEKERKKEWVQQKQTYKENAEEVRKQLQAFKEEYSQGVLSSQEALKRLETLSSLMRKKELGRDDVKALRTEMNAAKEPIVTQIKQIEEEKHKQELDRNRQRKETFDALKKRAEALIESQSSYDADQLSSEKDNLLTEIQHSQLNKNEKQEIERILKPLRDIITEKRESALLNLSDDDRHSIEQLKELLRQRKIRRQEIKDQLEVYRKSAGSSSLDFTKAMTYAAQINEENERLERANQGIKEIEDKLAELQSRVRKG